MKASGSKSRGVDFYIYSPQWGGTPKDVLEDPNIVSVERDTKVDSDDKHTNISVEYSDGSIGVFHLVEAIEYVSHLMSGCRYSVAELPHDLQKDFECFKNSIVQLPA